MWITRSGKSIDSFQLVLLPSRACAIEVYLLRAFVCDDWLHIALRLTFPDLLLLHVDRRMELGARENSVRAQLLLDAKNLVKLGKTF